VKQWMPGNTGWTDLGPTRRKTPIGRAAASDVTVRQQDGTTTVVPAYAESHLQKIIEDGRTNPRELPEDVQKVVEAARVADREDHKILEQQFAGIGASGSYGSLDGRNSRRPGKNQGADK
jgi:hypothetical protein